MMGSARYLRRVLSKETTLRKHPIVIGRAASVRLAGLLSRRVDHEHDRQHLRELSEELDRALVVENDQVPAQVITIGTRVAIRDARSGERQEMTVVLPQQADTRTRKISVLAPMGTALLGYSEGDVVEWAMPGGLKRMDIERVWQPDRAAPQVRG
jgi:regulator of nucleoside diphosphate kinase